MNMKKIASVICLGLCFTLSAAVKANAEVTTRRLSGSNRYGTNIAVTKSGWQGTSDVAIVVCGEGFADAVSAAPLAKKFNAPMLLTTKDSLNNQSDSLDGKASDELIRLKVKKVYIIGGTGVVSQGVEDTVKNMGIQTERVFGLTRYDTALEVAKKIGTDKGIVITVGEEFPDGLSIAPVAAAEGMPVILTQKDGLSSEVLSYIKDKKVPKAYVVGGSDIISDNLEKQLQGITTVERITGQDAFERNVNVLNKFSSDLNFSTTYVTSISGYADGISGSALAALTSSPIILLGETPQKVTEDFIAAKANRINSINVLGGEAVIKNETVKEVSTASSGNVLVKATLNSMNIKSMESTSTITLSVKAEGLPQDIQTQLNTVLPMINGQKLTFGIKSNSNDDKTAAKAKIELGLAQIPLMKTSIYIDTDLTGDKPKINEIIEIPPMLQMVVPQLAGKQYLTMDPTNMNSLNLPPEVQSQMPTIDYKKLMDFSKDYQSKISDFISNYAAQWKPDIKFVTYKGVQPIVTDEGTKNAECYEVKLNDEQLKALVSYTVENFMTNKEALSFVKDLMVSSMELSGTVDDAQKKEIEKAFDGLLANPQTAVAQFKAVMEKLKNLRILGDRGIQETYYIVDNYIIKTEGVLDLQLNLSELKNVVKSFDPQDTSMNDAQGTIYLGFDFETKTTNINKEVKIDIPQITKENSIDYFEFLNGMMMQQPQPTSIN